MKDLINLVAKHGTERDKEDIVTLFNKVNCLKSLEAAGVDNWGGYEYAEYTEIESFEELQQEYK